MLSVYEKIKKLQSEVTELEKEYEEKKNELAEKSEEFKEEHLFSDLRGASEYQYGPTIEGMLGLSFKGRYLNDLDFACTFYQKYGYVRQYVKMMDSFDESTKKDESVVVNPLEESIENINILGKYIYDDPLNISNDYRKGYLEFKEPIRAFKEFEYPLSLYTGTPVEYAIAIVALRLEKINFQELYDLKLECDNRLEHINEVKNQIKDYKVEVGVAIAKGAATKTEQAINTIVKPNVDRGIKYLIKKFAQSNDENQDK